MKLVKLFLISFVAFVVLLWGITLMFPSNTIISRVISVSDKADTLAKKIKSNEISMQTLLAGNNSELVVHTSDIPFYESNLFNRVSRDAVPNADTIFFRVVYHNEAIAMGGLALYQLSADSTTTQMFYVFQTPWYDPLHKMKMMMSDKTYGPSLDSALIRLKSMLATTK